MEKPKAILFDLDDTLMSFNGASKIAWKKCCDGFAVENKTEFNGDELLQAIYNTQKWYWADPIRHKIGRENMLAARREVIKYALETLDFRDEQKAAKAADGYSRMQEELWQLFDGVPEALEILKNNNISMAVITNGVTEIQNGKLRRFGVRDYFKHVICESELGVSKPDAQIFQIALDKLSLSPKDVWMIGDNLVWDVYGPQKLGIFSVWNDYEKVGLPVKSEIAPDMVVNSVYEMVKSIFL